MTLGPLGTVCWMNVRFVLESQCLTEIFAVLRVNWLRAKARHDRYKEDVEILQNEMWWMVLWFQHQTKKWEGLADGARMESKGGHLAYAEKQIAMWKAWGQECEKAFQDKRRTTIEVEDDDL